MRILVAPDKFAGTLSAVEAAEAIAAGWRRHRARRRARPGADVRRRARLRRRAARGAGRRAARRHGPRAARGTDAGDGAGRGPADTAYVESAQACGLHLTGRQGAEGATTYGVGELVAAAVDAGAATVVVGSAAAAPTTAAPGCSRRWAPPPTYPLTPVAPASTESRRSRWPPPATGSARSGWSRPATWTTR